MNFLEVFCQYMYVHPTMEKVQYLRRKQFCSADKGGKYTRVLGHLPLTTVSMKAESMEPPSEPRKR